MPTQTSQYPSYPYPPPAYGPIPPPSSHGMAIFALIVVGIVIMATIGTALVLMAPSSRDGDIAGNKFALVIGISHYQDSSLEDLNYCDDDARTWTSHLKSEGYSVRTLIDSQATENKILSEIEMMGSLEEDGDNVAFIFSGHGGYDYGEGESTICAYDVGTWNGEITDSDLAEAFSDFNSTHIFFFLDSCYSGGMDEITGPGRYVSQACEKFEESLEDPFLKHGVWTYWFLEYAIIKKGNDDMTSAYNLAYPNAVEDSSFGQHPEEEFTGTRFYL